MGVNGVIKEFHAGSDHAPTSDRTFRNDPAKAWIVQKFGGTSVGKVPEEIGSGIVKQSLATHRLAIVCSARSSDTKFAGTTNRLMRAASEAERAKKNTRFEELIQDIEQDHVGAAQKHIHNPELREQLVTDLREECQELVTFLGAAHKLGEVSTRTLDHVVSKGENLACRFMTALLQDQGVDAVFVDLANVIDFPVKEILDQAFYDHLARTLGDVVSDCGHRIPVITGYFGPIAGGLLSKIGRGYTDLCAALIAVGLHAEELQVWKEVDGIFTANPRQVPTARLLPTITPAEAAELTYYGSEVIHPFTMEQVIRARIPIRIRNVLNLRNVGTIILPDPATAPTSPSASGADSPTSELAKATIIRNHSIGQLSSRTDLRNGGLRVKRPTAVTAKQNIVVLNVHSNKRTLSHGFFAGIFSILDRCKLSVDLISTSEVHVSMALHSESAWLSNGGSQGAAAAKQMQDEIEDEIVNDDLRQAVQALTEFGRVDIKGGMAILSLVGKQMRHLPGIAGKMFSVLGEHDVNIEMISQGASEINISCVIQENDADRAINILHTNLFTFID